MRVQVFKVRRQAGTSKTSNKPYAFKICSIGVVGKDGLDVGEVVVDDSVQVTPGHYDCVVAPFVDFKTHRLSFRISQFLAVGSQVKAA